MRKISLPARLKSASGEKYFRFAAAALVQSKKRLAVNFRALIYQADGTVA